MIRFFFLTEQRYRIFLFPRNSLIFALFGQKSTDWVKNVFFFFSLLFFFSRPQKSSEWVDCKLFLGKKKYIKMLEKKIQPKCEKIAKNTCFWPFFVDIRFSGRVSGCKLFLGKKKKQLVFFFLHKVKKKNKNRENRVSEWR